MLKAQKKKDKDLEKERQRSSLLFGGQNVFNFLQRDAAILYQDDFEEQDEFILFFKSSWCNLSYSSIVLQCTSMAEVLKGMLIYLFIHKYIFFILTNLKTLVSERTLTFSNLGYGWHYREGVVLNKRTAMLQPKYFTEGKTLGLSNILSQRESVMDF